MAIDIGRNVGDCEIRSLSVLNNSIYIRLFDPEETNYFVVVFHGVDYLLFESNLMQNVIDSIKIYESVDELSTDVEGARFMKKSADMIAEGAATGKSIAYIRPIAGGETLLIFSHFELNE